MARYIDREKLRRAFERSKMNNKTVALFITEMQPIADVEEVKHGEWIGVADYGNGNCIGYCSVCGTTHKAENASELKCFQRYCRWCGAKMDGGNAEDV